jgi:hypothetical protein
MVENDVCIGNKRMNLCAKRFRPKAPSAPSLSLANFQTASGEFLISCLLFIVTQSLAGEGYLPASRQGVRGRMKGLVFMGEDEYNFFKY